MPKAMRKEQADQGLNYSPLLPTAICEVLHQKLKTEALTVQYDWLLLQ